MSMKVGLIAGDGNFPLEVAKSIYQQEKKVFIIALKGSASKNIEQYPHLWIRLGQIGKAIKALKENHCEELIIIGGVKKPNVWFLNPDFGALKLFIKLIMLPVKGDASILKTLLNFLERDNNFKIIGAEKYIPHLLMDKGLITGQKIEDKTRNDINIAIKRCNNIGSKDIGQACVVANGKIIASEGILGTDKMLKDIILRKIRFKNEGVLVKLAKPIQDRRVDLPAIGIRTIQLIKEIGLSGIALEEKSSFISEKEKVIEFANKNNIFIFGISNGKT